jgi:hypothetical protein
MTDRLKGCYVSFDQDIREDDAKGILEAIGMIKGVIGVTAFTVDHNDWMARARVKAELIAKIVEVLQ